jgi:hypothetical protein
MKRTYWRSLWAHRLNLLRKSLTMRTAILLLACLTVGCAPPPTEGTNPEISVWGCATHNMVEVLTINGHQYVVTGISGRPGGICHHFGCPCLERASGLTPEAEYMR